jgi:hypothetical protein
MVQHIATRCGCPWNGWSLDPFALCPALPDALGGRDATDYYGSAAPDSSLAICPPTLYREMFQVPALLAQHVLRQP